MENKTDKVVLIHGGTKTLNQDLYLHSYLCYLDSGDSFHLLGSGARNKHVNIWPSSWSKQAIPDEYSSKAMTPGWLGQSKQTKNVFK